MWHQMSHVSCLNVAKNILTWSSWGIKMLQKVQLLVPDTQTVL